MTFRPAGSLPAPSLGKRISRAAMQNVLFHAGIQCVEANRVLHCKNRNKHLILLEIQMYSIQLKMTFYAVEGGVAVQTLKHLGQHVARVGLWPPYTWESSLLQPFRSKGKPISDSRRSCINYFSAFPKNSSQIKLKAEKRNEGGLAQPPGRLQPAALSRTCSNAPQEHDVQMSVLDSYS